MLTRRGILGALGATVAAGPSVATGLAQQAISGSTVASAAGWGKIGSKGAYYDGPVCSDSLDGMSYADRLRQRLAEHLGMSSAEVRAQHEETLAEIAEADVMSLRSVSARHKTQMVIERRITRAHARQGNYLMRELMQAEKNA